jgi:hypothetical protein
MVMMKRAAQLTARKSVSIAEAGLSDVRRTDSDDSTKQPYMYWTSSQVPYCMPCVLQLYPSTAIRPFGLMMLSWST